MSETRYKGVKKAVIARDGTPITTPSGCSVVEGRKPGVTLDCEKYLNDKDKLASLSGPVTTYFVDKQ